MRHGIKQALTITTVVICLAALAAGAVILIQRKRAALSDAPRYGLEPTPVRVAAVRSGPLEVTRGYLGVVEPRRKANLAARLTSTVESVEVVEGQSVQAGHPLITLDDREIAAAIEAAKAQIMQAEAELAGNEATVSALEKSAAFWVREASRANELLSEGAIARSEAETTIDRSNQMDGQLQAARRKSEALQLQIEVLRKRVSELRIRLDYCIIASPFDGLVTRIDVDPGDQAAPGKPLLVVEDRSTLKLVFDIPQQDVPQVRAGMEVRFAGPDGERKAKLTKLFPSLDHARMLRAEVELAGRPAEKLNTGAYLPVKVVLESWSDVPILPGHALIESPEGRPYVFVIADGVIEPVEVTILGRSGQEIAVRGVEPGAEVVLSTFLGWSTLSAGLPVEVIR